ncbi:hypothetical protein B6U91_00115 [Candidatus Pacearchaeota archaeon ex4484_71]|nr:MAG: hypothetical protein B6U91_00115 [Candidatus Pacearchaeota archaeon ex4484_71]
MDSEKIIHIKFENSEAREAKKSVLLTEASFIKMHAHIKEFLELRKKELRNKSRMNTRIKKVISNIKKLENLNPKIQKPKILRKHPQERHLPTREIKVRPIKGGLEKELSDIQQRLKLLDKKF